MVPLMDREEVEGAIGCTTDGSGSNRNSDGCVVQEAIEVRKQSKVRWIRKKSKERWMVPPMDQEAVKGAMDGTND